MCYIVISFFEKITGNKISSMSSSQLLYGFLEEKLIVLIQCSILLDESDLKSYDTIRIPAQKRYFRELSQNTWNP